MSLPNFVVKQINFTNQSNLPENLTKEETLLYNLFLNYDGDEDDTNTKIIYKFLEENKGESGADIEKTLDLLFTIVSSYFDRNSCKRTPIKTHSGISPTGIHYE